MKQYRWILILAAAAILLTGIFIVVDRKSKQKEETIKAGEAKTLFAIDPTISTRLILENEEGTFTFVVNPETDMWELEGDDQFNLNVYAVAAINNYFCTLSSEKTVAFDCKDTSVYGFSHPVTLKLYNKDTGDENPYILYIGDNTPTYDSYYAMVDGSNDVYTIDYTSGSIFCAAKDTLKNMYLFDTYSTLVSYYKVEKDGKTVIELNKNSEGEWNMAEPKANLDLSLGSLTSLLDSVVRVELDGFVEENPQDLAQYGLDKPQYKLWLKATKENENMEEEIWFGSSVSDFEDEPNIYGYFANSKQVFSIKRSAVSFIDYTLDKYISPYCVNVKIEDLKSLEIDMGDIYDMHELLTLDYANSHFKLGDQEIDSYEDDTLDTLFADYYRSISNLRLTEIDLEGKPDPEAEPAMSITYNYQDGTQKKLTFVERSDHYYYMLEDGTYNGIVVRLNNFTGAGTITPAYEALTRALNEKTK